MKYRRMNLAHALINLLASCTSSVLADQVSDFLEISERLESAVRSSVQEGFAGVVKVGKGDKLILDRAYGAAGSIPIRTNSRFWIASAGKQFTSALILRCEEDGLLSLDDTIGKFFPAAPTDKSNITIRQLLSHQSGLPQGYETESVNSAEEAVDALMALSPVGPAGLGFNYSNNNYQLAAAIIEKVTGKSYSAVLHETFFNPLALHDSGQAGPEISKSVLPAVGPTPDRLMRASWGGQGHFASADDLWKWLRALLSGNILSENSVKQLMMQGISPIREGQSALGWFVGDNDYGHRRVFTRGNEDFGPNSLVYYYPASEVLIIVLTHSGSLNGDLSFSRTLHSKLESILEIEQLL